MKKLFNVLVILFVLFAFALVFVELNESDNQLENQEYYTDSVFDE
ncbi:hypothetical protein [Mangrovimonas yunxiaonensis]|nr:hypothetical protein [Mangrovimonas yunxiaonensis]GGH44994.1 hypothetical protein GCM10011364_18130 [Mangrovimonas yunxiaonensis]